MTEIVGVLKLSDKKLHGHTKKGLPIYTFIPLSWTYPTFLVASSSREKRNLLAVIQPDKTDEADEKVKKQGQERGTCIQVIGPVEDHQAYDQALILKNNLRANLKAHRCVSSEVTPVSHTADYPKIIVIDPEGSTDCDDGFHISGDYLYVHIADVDHYFPKNGPYESEIRKRTTSIYSTYKVYHMLPENYASDIISLNKKGIKHTLTAVFKITEHEVSFLRVHQSTVKVAHSLSYESAQDILELPGSKKNEDASAGALGETLKRLSEITGSTDTHKMIERIMVWTNEAIAKFIYDNGVNFSVHCEGPDNIENPGESSVPLPLPLKLKQILSRKGIGAKYSTKQHGHKMMGLEHYTHFTSPIRRYADLVVHRIVKSILSGHVYNIEELQELEQDAEHINMITDWSKKYYRDQDLLILLSKLPKQGSLQTTAYIIGNEDEVSNKVRIYLTDFDLLISVPLFAEKLEQVINVTHKVDGSTITLDINGSDTPVTVPLFKEIPVMLTALEAEIRLNRKIRVTFPFISSAVLS